MTFKGYNSVYSSDSAEESEREQTRKTKLGKRKSVDEGEDVNDPGSSSFERGFKSNGRGKKQSMHPGGGMRDSQFADADEASVQEHIEQRIAAGVHMVS